MAEVKSLPFPHVPFDQERPLAVTHVPKTAGIALRQALERALAPNRVLTGFDRSLFGDFQAFDTMPPARRAQIFCQSADLPDGVDLYFAHMAYSTTRQAAPFSQHVLVLREPMTRLLSHFLHWRGRPDNVLESWGDWSQRIRLSHGGLHDFLSDDRIACQTDNIAVRMLLWPDQRLPPAGFINVMDDQALLADAMGVLGRYVYADTIENPRFQAKMTEWLGREIILPRSNVTDSVPSERRLDFASLLTPQAMGLMHERTRLDDQLWRAVLAPPLNVDIVRLTALTQAVARYGALMAPLQD